MDSKRSSRPLSGSPSNQILDLTVPDFVLPAVVTCRSPIGARPSSPGAILGYTGGRFRNYSEEGRKVAITPISGYTGDFIGKVEGKIGRIETHRRPLSEKSNHEYPEVPDEWNSITSPVGSRANDSPSFHSSGGSLSPTSPSKKFIVGYTGAKFKVEQKPDPPKVLVPIVGYSGDFVGKSSGKLGRIEKHFISLSKIDQDTAYDILGENKFHQRKSVKDAAKKNGAS